MVSYIIRHVILEYLIVNEKLVENAKNYSKTNYRYLYDQFCTFNINMSY